MLDLIEARKPKQLPNPNINQYEEDQLPVPDKTSQTQASWLKSPSSAVVKKSLLVLNERSEQNMNIGVASRGPFTKLSLASGNASDQEEGQSKEADGEAR